MNRIILCLLLLCASSLQAYEPVLRKVGPEPSKIIVVDVTKEQTGSFYNPQSTDVLATIATLQGLINSQLPEKIYLKNIPVHVYWQTGLAKPDRATSLGVVNPHDILLRDEVLPYPKETADLDMNETYPALVYLLENYGHLLQGQIKVPAVVSDSAGVLWQKREGQRFTGDKPYHDNADTSGARAAGMTACGFESAVLVSPYTEPFVRAVLELETLHDLSEMDNIEALDWSIENYIDHPDRNPTSIGFYADLAATPPMMVDYWVATKSFVFFLNSMVESEKEHFEALLRPEFYEPATYIIGCVEGGKGIVEMQRLGYQTIASPIGNLSVTSAVPTDPTRFQTPPPAKAHSIDGNDIYITFRGTDEALTWTSFMMPASTAADEHRGEIPMGWSYTPVYFDLNPGLVEWYSKQFPETLEMIASMNDGGMPQTDAGQDGWVERYRHYLENDNGLFSSMIYFGPYQEGSNRQLVEMFGDEIEFISRNYQGTNWKTRIELEPEFQIIDDTVVFNVIGLSRFNRHMVPDWIFEAASPLDEGDFIYEYAFDYDLYSYLTLKRVIEQSDPDEPLFIGYRLSGPRGIQIFSRIKHLIDLLEEDESIDRRINVLLPRDMAATLKAAGIEAQP